MMYCETMRLVRNEYISCVSQSNDTYKKVYKVDRQESLKKHTQVNKQIPKSPLLTESEEKYKSHGVHPGVDITFEIDSLSAVISFQPKYCLL